MAVEKEKNGCPGSGRRVRRGRLLAAAAQQKRGHAGGQRHRTVLAEAGAARVSPSSVDWQTCVGAVWLPAAPGAGDSSGSERHHPAALPPLARGDRSALVRRLLLSINGCSRSICKHGSGQAGAPLCRPAWQGVAAMRS